MKLIEDLGMLEYGTQGKLARYGIYECPSCNNHVKCSTTSIQYRGTRECTKCASIRVATIKAKAAAEVFVGECTRIHNNKYDYSLIEYINNKIPVIIICPEHGKFSQTPNMHKRGNGCIRCAKESSARVQSGPFAQSFVERCVLFHGDTYNYKFIEYVNSKIKVKIVCDIHGIFEQTPYNHIKGQGCPSCAIHGFDKTKKAILYYLKVTTESIITFKIGITNRTVQERFNTIDLQKIKILKLWHFEIGEQAYLKEQEILQEFTESKYTGENVLRSGNSELFTHDVLNLDY